MIYDYTALLLLFFAGHWFDITGRYITKIQFNSVHHADIHEWRNIWFDISGRYITIKKNHSLTDESLEWVGKHHPVSLALIQCHGDYITAKGLRNLFRACANSLKVWRRADCWLWHVIRQGGQQVAVDSLFFYAST